MKVRQATAHDISGLVVLLEQWRDESPFDAPPIHYPKLVDVLNNAMTNFLCAVAENEDGELVGCACATISDWFFSNNNPRVSDLLFFVAKAHRDSRAAVQLMRTMMKYAARKELPFLTGPTDGNDLDRKEKFYESFGLRKYGVLYGSDLLFQTLEE